MWRSRYGEGGSGSGMQVSLARYWRTMRHLRPVQLYGRILYRWRRPKIEALPAPARRVIDAASWVAPASHEASMVAPTQFCFLGASADLDMVGWDDPGTEKLWRYNLHYFADLTSADASARAPWHQELLTRWVRENPAGRGTGWEPYPTSLRIVNWIKFALAGNVLPATCIESLAVQARWLTRRLERHLLGNHLFANAKALLFAGAFFDGPEADVWSALGAAILLPELAEQILPDGGHFERSTMYHALALEDVLDLSNVAAACAGAGNAPLERVDEACRARVGNMRRWLGVMTHPDGEIAFFNDAAIGIAPSPPALEAYARRLQLPPAGVPPTGLTLLAESGYARLANSEAVAVIDVAPIGPDYLPAHAHADTLSFELSLRGQRLFVNTGTSCYGLSRERLRQRGTAAHNTLTIDDSDSSEVWSGFRVGRRAYPAELRLGGSADLEIEASHDGYAHRPGAPIHRRRLTLEPHALTIVDQIIGTCGEAVARLHLHPSITVEPRDSGPRDLSSAVLRMDDGQRVRITITGGTLHLEPSSWHPRFGESAPSVCCSARMEMATMRTRVEWDVLS